jgi:integrase
MGFPMKIEESQLRDFVVFVTAKNAGERINAQLALDWACSSPRCGVSSRAGRLSTVRGWLRYLSAFVPEVEVPEAGLLPGGRRNKPYLFSPVEIQQLLEGASRLQSESAFWPQTVATVIGLVASTGLRSKEALKLTVADVQLDMDPPRLLIRQTKFRKSRIVPLHVTAAKELHQYADQRRRLGYDGREAFFISERGKQARYTRLSECIRQLIRGLGIQQHPRSGRFPGLHSLRHTFAVQRLLAWQGQGLDVNALLPHLSVYLGHRDPVETYWYLTATPALLTAAAQRFADYAGTGVRQ